ncbi:MAG TPA: acyltransferase [Candidatus Gastranaerophilales bacterium]|nr:acyltransferase [Candidatus Gastranaerophilales bacterium]
MCIKSRNTGLDVVRSIAILLVLVCHITMWLSTLYTQLYGEFKIPFKFFSSFGWLGVEIFFVLSGFLIGKIFIEDFITGFNGSNKRTLLKFYSRRWFRTLPMYYLMLIINIILLITAFPTHDTQIFLQKASNYFLFLQNFYGRAELGGLDLMAVSWSLVLEEWFYLLFPIFIIILRKTSKNFTHQTFLKFLIVFILSISISRIWHVFFQDIRFGSVTSAVFLRLDTFAIGILFAYLQVFLPDLYNVFIKKRYFILSVFFIILTYFLAIYFNAGLIARTVLFTALPFAIAVFMVFLERKMNGENKIVEFTSKISYSLYLIHVPLLSNFLAPCAYILYVNTIKIPLFVTFAIFFILIYAVAAVFYRYYEKPMMNLRDKRFIKNLFQLN